MNSAIANIRRALSLSVRRACHQRRIRSAAGRRGRTSYQPLFIISQPRTGSTYLQNLLDSVPDVAMTGEVLSVTLPIGIRPTTASKPAALKHVSNSLAALSGTVSGAKFLIDQMNLHDLCVDDLRTAFPNAKYLILYRESVLDQMVSFRIAQATNQWVGRGGNAYRFSGRIRISVEELRERHEHEQCKYEELMSHSWLRESSAVFSYESLIKSPQELFQSKVFPLLEIAGVGVESDMTKQMARPISDVVENFPELQPLLSELSLHLDWDDSCSHVCDQSDALAQRRAS